MLGLLKKLRRTFSVMKTKRSGLSVRSCPSEDVYLTLHLVAPLKPLHPPQSIYHSTLTGEKWMALTAQLNL